MNPESEETHTTTYSIICSAMTIKSAAKCRIISKESKNKIILHNEILTSSGNRCFNQAI